MAAKGGDESGPVVFFDPFAVLGWIYQSAMEAIAGLG
jgi:hypothetical protein